MIIGFTKRCSNDSSQKGIYTVTTLNTFRENEVKIDALKR